MASSSAIRAGKAFVEIGGDDSALKRALKSVQEQLKKFGTAVRNVGIGIGAIGASITAPLQLAIHAFEQSGTALLDMSKRTGISVEALSEFQYAAQQTSTDIGTFEGAIKKMSKALISADEESKSAQKALARIGLNVDEIRNLKPDEQFERIAAALNAITDPTLKSAAALAIFGKSGTALLPMIEQMEALRAHARALGFVMSTEDAEAAHKLDDAMTDLKYSIDYLKNAIGAALAARQTAFAEGLAVIVSKITAFVRANRDAVVAVSILGTSLTVAGGALAALGTAISLAAPALGIVASVIATIVSPIGLAVGALATLAGYFIYSATCGTTFAERLHSIGELTLDVFTAVAFAATNWKATLEIAFLSAILGIVRFGNEVAYWFGTVVPTWLGYLIFNWQDTFKTIWDYTRTVISNLYENLVEFFAAVINWLQGDEFKFEWKGLTEGFQSSLRDLPVIAEREIGALEGAIASELDQLNKTMDGKFDEFRERFRAKLGDLKDKLGQLVTPVAPPPGPPPIQLPDLEGVADKLKTSVSGTFSSAALSQLGAGSPPVEEVARNTRPLADIRDGIKELNRTVRNNGLAFG